MSAHDSKLIGGLHRIRSARKENLQDAAFVASLVCDIGLQLHTVTDPGELYGHDVKHMNDGPGIYQIPTQLAEALVFLSGKGIARYAEIGIFHGWTFSFIVAYLDRFTKIERAVAVDTLPQFSAFNTVRDTYPIELVEGTSDLIRGQAFDLVFIDACHEYHWCKRDYDNLSFRARYCMLHDVNDSAVRAYVDGDSVPEFWAELKARYRDTCVEFLGHSNRRPAMGIGIVQLG